MPGGRVIDTAKRVERVRAFDELNFGPKTTVTYNYKKSPLRGNNVHSVGDSIYGGGVFSEGKILKEWKIVK